MVYSLFIAFVFTFGGICMIAAALEQRADR